MTRTILTLLLAAALVGCASDYAQVDAALGKSQAQMIRAQTYDPQAAAHPPALAPAHADGQRLANVLAEHRKDVPQQASKQVSQTKQFDVGGQ
ncbi:MAG TPA: hypothetical protein VN750_20630 [Steroidobacteraceae bacterium]|nr:hypothetical protein [Steroidobacteraceae bacterium]